MTCVTSNRLIVIYISCRDAIWGEQGVHLHALNVLFAVGLGVTDTRPCRLGLQLKTFLRTTMGDDRQSDLMVLNV